VEVVGAFAVAVLAVDELPPPLVRDCLDSEVNLVLIRRRLEVD
jgi:hypothetical protein